MKKKFTTDTTEIERIIRDCYEQLYTDKMGNLEEMDKFLEMYNLPTESGRNSKCETDQLPVMKLNCNKKFKTSWLHR